MKVLHAGIFKDHDLGGDIIFEKGLKLNGCNVERFDYRELVALHGKNQMESLLIQQVIGKDILFIGKGEAFSADTLKKVRHLGITVVLWYGDIRSNPEPWLLTLLPEVDYYFMSSGGETLKEYFVKGSPKTAAYFFNPTDPDLTEKYSEGKSITSKVVFTGSNYSFVGNERKSVIEALKKRNDVTFFGGADQSRSLVKRVIAKATRKPVGNRVRGEDYINAIKNTGIGVGVSAFHNVDYYTSDRLSHYLTFGTFYLPYKYPGIEKFFDYGKEIIWFSDVSELSTKLDYYLKEKDERELIASKGQQRALKEYNTQNIVGMMLDIISTGQSKRFEWVEVLSN